MLVTINSADRFDVFHKEMRDKYGYNGTVEYQENKDYLLPFLLKRFNPSFLLIVCLDLFHATMSEPGGGGVCRWWCVFSVGKIQGPTL
jgi:hypothetical protein